MPPKKKLTKREIESAVASGQIAYKDPKSKGRKGYEVRLVAENTFVSDTYPGFADHPSLEGSLEYLKHVNTSEAASVWEAIANENYAKGGMPIWIRNKLSDLDVSIYWQLTWYQRVWGGNSYPSFKTLSRNLGCKYRSVQRSIHRLLDVGVIELKRKSSGRRTNMYKVLLFSQVEPPSESLFKKGKVLETTDEDLEATSQHAIDDHAVAQKTKPLKGRVARSPAEAGRATPRKNKSALLLQTIDEASNSRHKKIAQARVNVRPKIIRPFHSSEVTQSKLMTLVGDMEFLALNWEKTKEQAKISGSIDFEHLRILPAPESEDEGLARYCAKHLTSNNLDVTNLPKSLDLILRSCLMQQEKISTELAYKLNQAIRQKKDEECRNEEIRLREESRLAVITKERLLITDKLLLAHQFLQKVVPNFADLVNNWGSALSALNELETAGKENRKLPDLHIEVGAVATQVFQLVTELRRVDALEAGAAGVEATLNQWFESGIARHSHLEGVGDSPPTTTTSTSLDRLE